MSDDQYKTRPGTPMIGDYSINQMDDFYSALFVGQVKPSGIMNYAQHLFVAERCSPGDVVVDVCCGRGLQLPVLYRYAPNIARYVGLDISIENLQEVTAQVERMDAHYERSFQIDFIECDVVDPWSGVPVADVIVYTSAVEHLPREKAITSLRNAANSLAPSGTLYLSTPNTPGPPPRPLQYRVHVYEWNFDELAPVLSECGLEIERTIGLLPPDDNILDQTIESRFGEGARRWLDELRHSVPAAFLAPVLAAAAPPDTAMELMYVCKKVVA